MACQFHLAYFSPTLNGAKIGKSVLSGALKGAGSAHEAIVQDWQTPEKRQQALQEGRLKFKRNDALVIVFPVYAGRLPNLLLPFIEQISGENTTALAIVTYGYRAYDDALSELCGLLNSKGFIVQAAAAFPCAHAFSKTLGEQRPNEADLKLAYAWGERWGRFTVRHWASDFRQACQVKGAWPPGPYYQPRALNGERIDIRKVKPKIHAHCTHCGYCAAICPMGAIDPKNVASVPGICMKCNACVQRCPEAARYFDDAGYLTHKTDLENQFTERKSIELFWAGLSRKIES